MKLDKAIAFVPTKNETLTRVGGGANLPSKKDWPEDDDGNPMVFLLQIDLDELPKNRFKILDKGLLQFYTSGSDDEFYGMSEEYFDEYNVESLISGSNVRVLYWEELGQDNKGVVVHQPGDPEYTVLNHPDKGQNFEPKMVDSEPQDDEWEFRIGGYPYFTQDDSIMDELEEYFPLLNYPGTEYAMWGDSGSASWWIHEKDLMKGDFNNVFLYWDCY